MSNLNKFGITEAQMLALASQNGVKYRFGDDGMRCLLAYSQALLSLAAPSVASGAVDIQLTRYRLHENCPGAMNHKDGEFYKVEDVQAAIAAQAKPAAMTDEKIKAIFLANGFTIKEGNSDLKPYVYAAARAILANSAPNAALVEALQSLYRGYVQVLELGRDRILSLGGDCDPVDRMEASDPELKKARAALAAAGVEVK